MAKKTAATSAQAILDAVRPAESDGPIQSVILSTYGLSLEDPNFFEHDLLPTLLGLGGIRDRGYVAPVALERKLAETYCALICDAHAMAAGIRPSLRVDVIPIASPRHHAKLTLIHRRNLIRAIISSANLTHDGFRRQREVVTVLDFRPEGGLHPEILSSLVQDWLTTLGPSVTPSIRTALDGAVIAAATWRQRAAAGASPKIQVVFGGGAVPLWRRLVDAWPAGEPLVSWQICSPFWPGVESRTTPFDAIARGLDERGAELSGAEIEVICPADVPGDRARPLFPFPLLRDLRERNFPVKRGRIWPARLEALAEEVPDKMAEGHRPLHAKLVILRGPRTAVILIGSANFTNTGLGVAGTPNIEACILLTCQCGMLHDESWRPPVAESGCVDWATCASTDFSDPIGTPDDPVDWPAHLHAIELDIQWETGPDPSGILTVEYEDRPTMETTLSVEHAASNLDAKLEAEVARIAPGSSGPVRVSISATLVRRLLVSRCVRVRWDEPMRSALFPINIRDAAKSGLPSVLGARPDEQQLLAYFHGRIDDDDLLSLLEDRAKQSSEHGSEAANSSPSAELQSYLIREFVETLYGLEDMLKQASRSHRALETALLGEFSPVALAERLLFALRTGRRSPTGAAFQFVELIRVVFGLPIEATVSDQRPIRDLLNRCIDRLLAFVSQAAHLPSFTATLRDLHFSTYVRATLPRSEADRVLTLATVSSSGDHIPEEASRDVAT